MRHDRWFRILAVLFGLALLAAACGGDDDDGAAGDGGGGDGGGDVPSVGIVFDLGGRGDQSFNDAAVAGLERAVDELGIETPQELEPDEGGENREQLLVLLAEEGTDLVIANGFLFEDSVTAVAPQFPDQSFAIVDSVVDEPNVASLVFAEEEGSFLVGAAAALTSQTGKIGFIGGVETDLIKKFEAGYVAGAREVNPEIEVDVKYLTQPPDFGGFNDPARGREVGSAQYAAGADVVYAAAGGSGGGLFEAAREASSGGQKVWAIGVDSDQYNLVDDALKDYILTSMLKKVDVAVFETVQKMVDGEDVGGTVTTFDLSIDGVGYSTSGGHLADDVIERLEELKQRIIDGDIEVPTSP